MESIDEVHLHLRIARPATFAIVDATHPGGRSCKGVEDQPCANALCGIIGSHRIANCWQYRRDQILLTGRRRHRCPFSIAIAVRRRINDTARYNSYHLITLPEDGRDDSARKLRLGFINRTPRAYFPHEKTCPTLLCTLYHKGRFISTRITTNHNKQPRVGWRAHCCAWVGKNRPARRSPARQSIIGPSG